MGVVALGGEPGALSHAEPVLLVGDDQAQVGKYRLVRHQGMGADDKIQLSPGDLFPDQGLVFRGQGAGQQPHPDAQGLQKLRHGGMVLLCQDFRGGHHGRLAAVGDGAVGSRRGHHGLAAAHVALNKAVHGSAPAEIPQNIVDALRLRACEPEGQGAIEGCQVSVFIGRAFFVRPGRPHQAQSRGKDEKFLKNQPPFCRLGFRHVPGLVDRPVGLLRREDIIARPDFGGNDLRGGIADGQGLAHQLQQGAVVQPRSQGVDGQHPPGGDRLGIQGLEGGIGHIIADEIPADRAVEDILLAVVEILGDKAAVEKGQVQPGGVIRHLHLGDVQSLADVGGAGGVHHRGPEAGGHIHLQFIDGDELRAILVAPGEMADQILQGENIQIFQLLRPGGAHAAKHGDGICESGHR